MGDVVLGPDSKLQSAGEVEECHSAMFEFPAHNALGWKLETISIEGDGPVEVGDADRQDRNARLHGDLLELAGSDLAVECVEDLQLTLGQLSSCDREVEPVCSIDLREL